MNHHKKDKDIEIEEVPVEEKSGNIMEWESPEYEYLEKTISWYWITLILSILLIGYALWTKNFLFAVFIVIAELLVLNFGGEEPKLWSFFITNEGIGVGRTRFHNFKEIISYDIHPSSEDFDELILKTKKRITPVEKILIHAIDTEIIDERLSQHLKKEDIHPGLVEILGRIIRF